MEEEEKKGYEKRNSSSIGKKAQVGKYSGSTNYETPNRKSEMISSSKKQSSATSHLTQSSGK